MNIYYLRSRYLSRVHTILKANIHFKHGFHLLTEVCTPYVVYTFVITARMDPEDICLDIAIDHRIKMLFGPIELNQSHAVAAPQSHVHLLTRLARTVERDNEPIPNEEVQVARELALPSSPGGMLIMLFQPANDHPYHLGTRVTVQSSPTLHTTDAMLRTVSCGTLNINNVSLVDSLLFVRKCDDMSEADKNTVRQNVYDIVVAKQPKGVLCMWSDRSATTEIKYLQSCGVGNSYPENVELPLGLATHRINAFHPSYAVNYNPEFSLLRQLLLLETAHGVQLCYNGDWQEREWMRDLRRKCKGVASQISGIFCMNVSQDAVLKLISCRIQCVRLGLSLTVG